MISFDAAYDLVWDNRFTASTEKMALGSALGRTLSEDVVAPFPMPRFDNSAMDGYAVGSPDGPWTITHTVAAGAEAYGVASTEAARVLTGAPVPEGTYAVVAQEEAHLSGTKVAAETRLGAHVRRRGEDVQVGDVVVSAGLRLDPPKVSAIAAVGQAEVHVFRCPKVMLISTGNELASLGHSLAVAQVYDSNRPGMEAALTCLGARVQSCRVNDSVTSLVDAVSSDVDLVLTTAGASVGDHDFVQRAMAELGFEILFAGVSMKPGKPVTFAKRDNQYWLALPGNPMAAFTTFALLGSAWLGIALRPLRLPILNSFSRKPGREEFVPCRWGSDGVEALTFVGSHSVTGFVQADGLVRVPADVDEVCAGTVMSSYLFPWRFI